MSVVPSTSVDPARAGAFGRVRARWLPLWAVAGVLAVGVVSGPIAQALGLDPGDDLTGVLFYVPLVAWIAFVAWRYGVDLRVLFRPPTDQRIWWLAGAMVVPVMVFSLAAASLTSLLLPGLDDGLEGVGQGNLVVAVLSLAVLPPLVEETLFRGILLERWAFKWRMAIGILVSSIAFGLLHADPVGAGVFGVVASLLYLRSGSLWPSILLHAINNAIVLLAVRSTGAATAQESPSTGDVISGALVFLVLSIPFLVWFIRVNWPARTATTPYQRYERDTLGVPMVVSGAALPFPMLGESGVPGDLTLPHQQVWPWPEVQWSAQLGRVDLDVWSDRLVVRRALGQPATGSGGEDASAEAFPSGARSVEASEAIAILPLVQIAAVYPSAAVVGLQVVVLHVDGHWTTFQARGGEPEANVALAACIEARVHGTRALPPAW